MKKLILVLLVSYGVPSYCQNLVPNPGFEFYIGCPSLFYSIDSIQTWFNPAPWSLGGGSPDYYNACDVNNGMGVPNNFQGFQSAHQGNAYCGLCLNVLAPNSYWREYIEVQLLSPLSPNTCYEFSLYANLSNNAMYTTDRISVLFSDSLISVINNNYILPFTPQINPQGPVCDSMNWVRYSSTYTAFGGEQFIIIGNFSTNANSNAFLANSNAILDVVYFYLDDVSLIEIPPCNTGEDELSELSNVEVFYDPFLHKIICDSKEIQNCKLTLLDVMGREVNKVAFSGKMELNCSELTNGAYIYCIGSSGSILKNGKVIIY